MKGKSSIKYQLSEMKSPVAIFYFIMFCILVLGFTFKTIGVVSINGSSVFSNSSLSGPGFTGMEAVSAIFLFVCGLNSFKEFFRMLTQNGLSRKTIFAGRIITFLALCAGMAVIDKFILVVGKIIAAQLPGTHFAGLFE